MRRMMMLTVAILALFRPSTGSAVDRPAFDRKSDVIYGRKVGTALTMDVFSPRTGANGSAVVLIVSGGYFSSHEAINPVFFLPLIHRGYTVFAVVHGSQPRFTVPASVLDVNRAIRFIRHNAKEFGIDPNRIGATGASAGGHLSLLLGTAGDLGNPEASDPVDRESSRVQAVACFFPPTDFLSYGAAGREMLNPKDFGRMFRPAFDFRELDPAENVLIPVVEPDRRREILRKISPANHVSADDAPSLIYHGDADSLVPVQQSELIVEKFQKAGVEARLVVKQRAGHGWLSMVKDMEAFADWFDRHLKAVK